MSKKPSLTINTENYVKKVSEVFSYVQQKRLITTDEAEAIVYEVLDEENLKSPKHSEIIDEIKNSKRSFPKTSKAGDKYNYSSFLQYAETALELINKNDK